MICVYDNPATMSRECWQDGRLQASMKWRVFLLPPEQRPRKVHMGMNLLGDFKAGQHHGDLRAMEAKGENK